MLIAAAAAVLVTVLAFRFIPPVYASVVNEAAEAVTKVVKLIATAIGAIFILVGVLKFAISYSNDDGPQQQKAVMMLAAGLVLVLLSQLVLDDLDIASWISSAI